MEEEKEREEKFPLLTKKSWHDFSAAFKEYALTCGDAGDEILRRARAARPEPNRDEMIIREQQNAAGVVEARRVRKYEDTARGDKLFADDLKEWKTYREDCRRMIAKLLRSTDKEVKDAMITTANYEQLLREYNQLGMYQLAEQVCVGVGAVSVYTQVMKILKCKQTGPYISYEKEFKELAIDI
jgi:hypothetical protein